MACGQGESGGMENLEPKPRDIYKDLFDGDITFFCPPQSGSNGEIVLTRREPSNGHQGNVRFYISDPIGNGKQGAVYKASNSRDKQRVCVKLPIYEKLERAKDDYKTFKQEAEFYRKLNHPNVASMFVYGAIPNTFDACLVLERCRGNTLFKLSEHYKKKKSQIPFEVRCKVMKDATEAAKHCSEMNIAHCDLSPKNFVWYPSMDEPVKLIDFGMAVFIDTKETFKGGTEGFKSPEHLMRHLPHLRSDVFGLGCLYRYLAVGEKFSWNHRFKVEGIEDLDMFQRELSSQYEQEVNKIRMPDEQSLVKEMLVFKADDRCDYDVALRKLKKMKPGYFAIGNALSTSAFQSQKDSEPMPIRNRQEEGSLSTNVADVQQPEDSTSSGPSTDQPQFELQPIEVVQPTSEVDSDDEEGNAYTQEIYATTFAALEIETREADMELEIRIKELERLADADNYPQRVFNNLKRKLDESSSINKQKYHEAINQANIQDDPEEDAKDNAQKIRNVIADQGHKAADEIQRYLDDERKAMVETEQRCLDGFRDIFNQVDQAKAEVYSWEVEARCDLRK